MLPLEMLLLVPKGWKIVPWPCCSRGVCCLHPKTLLLTCWRRSRKGSVIMLCRNFQLDCAPAVFGKGHLYVCARVRVYACTCARACVCACVCVCARALRILGQPPPTSRLFDNERWVCSAALFRATPHLGPWLGTTGQTDPPHENLSQGGRDWGKGHTQVQGLREPRRPEGHSPGSWELGEQGRSTDEGPGGCGLRREGVRADELRTASLHGSRAR